MQPWRRAKAALRRARTTRPVAPGPPDDAARWPSAVTAAGEAALRERLREDPNDVAAFATLAGIVRTRADDRRPTSAYPRRPRIEHGDDDAVWALAEELAHSPRAWFPLVELARLSLADDRETAMRRLGTAAERDPSGQALAQGLAMLRRAGHPAEALNLGVGHWRPREHEADAGRHLVEAAVEAGRVGEARRHLAALAAREDADRLAPMLQQLEALVRRAGEVRSVDLRDTAQVEAAGRRRRRR